MAFKINSNDTLSQINLHDCVCNQLNYCENQLVLDLEWIEVLAAHPDNPFDKAHQTDVGKIIFFSPVLLEGKLIPWNEKEKTSISTLERLSYSHLTMLDFSVKKMEDCYQAYLFAELNESESCLFIELSITYVRSEIMWNELNSESWFEDEKWKKR